MQLITTTQPIGAALSQALRDVERCQEAVRSAKQALQVRGSPQCHGDSQFFLRKSTISMAIFNSYVRLPEGTG